MNRVIRQLAISGSSGSDLGGQERGPEEATPQERRLADNDRCNTRDEHLSAGGWGILKVRTYTASSISLNVSLACSKKS